MIPDTLLPVPKKVPPLDPGFRPAILARRAFARLATVPIHLALEQSDGSVFHHSTAVLAESHPYAEAANPFFLERLAKFLLWAWGGRRIWFVGPKHLAHSLAQHYRATATGQFDSEIIAERIYGSPLEIIHTDCLPPPQATSTPLGRHLDGCRIGFDLGGSDRKVAAVQNGIVLFSEEIVWDPYFQTNPNYHLSGIQDSLNRASAHLPRVDAIGGSAAGIFLQNQVKVSSLFRGVSKSDFDAHIRDLFLNLKHQWKGIPFEVLNDGEVTALAASMSLGVNSVLGVSMGTSTAAGFVNSEGHTTDWLNELAFAPIDYRPNGPRDEWGGDLGCGVQFFSQQGVGRLIPAAGLDLDPALPLPEKLKRVQSLLAEGDSRAQRLYETIGVCFGYAVAHWADFYDFRHLLILGRVTSGLGGDIILRNAESVLETEFPELAAQIRFHIPNEKDKRHGQAIAAASLARCH